MRECPRCGRKTEGIVCTVDGTPTIRGANLRPVAVHPAVGTVIGGRYRVLGELGRGGFGVVLDAVHVTTGHSVAVKVLSDTEDDDGPELAQRFFQEAATTSRLSHPNTVRVFDFGKTDAGVLYLAMERLNGETLQARLQTAASRQEVLPESETAEIADAVLRSLAEAHAHGLVHRDLKPANIFLHQTVVEEVVVKVLDFGIVKQHDASMTQAGKSLGTPTHMSPEQALGDPIDGRSDLYALAVILFECLTGQLPFRADTPLAMVLQHVTEPAPPLASRAPQPVRPALAALIDKALAKKPADRWPTAQAMRQALQAAMATPAPVVAATPAMAPQSPPNTDAVTTDRAPTVPPAVARRAPKPGPPPRVQIEPAPSLSQRIGATPRQPRPEPVAPVVVQPTPAAPVRPTAAPARFAATALALFADWRFAAWAEPAGALWGLDLPALEDGRSEPESLQLVDLSGRIELGHHPAVVSCLLPLADGRTLASGCIDGTLRLWDIGSCTLGGQLSLGAAIVSLAGSQDGKLLVAGLKDGTVALIDLPDLQLRRLLRGHTSAVTAVAASGSRRLVVTADQDGMVRAWDPVGGGARLSSRGHDGPVSALVVLPDGATVVSGGWDGKVRAWQHRTGQLSWERAVHREVVAALTVDAKGLWLASSGDDRSIRVLSAQSGQTMAERTGLSAGVKILQPAAQGNALAYLGWDGTAGCLRWSVTATDTASHPRVKGSHV